MGTIYQSTTSTTRLDSIQNKTYQQCSSPQSSLSLLSHPSLPLPSLGPVAPTLSRRKTLNGVLELGTVRTVTQETAVGTRGESYALEVLKQDEKNEHIKETLGSLDILLSF